MLFHHTCHTVISPVVSNILRLVTLCFASALASFSISSHAQVAIDCQGTTPIYEIQGKGHMSPFIDQTVETCGVVTAVGFNFYSLQDAFGNNDIDTADGMYVFTTDEKPVLGDEIRISRAVSESIPGGAASGNLSTTRMSFPDILDSASADMTPTPVFLGEAGRAPPTEIVISDDREQLLRIADQIVINLKAPDIIAL